MAVQSKRRTCLNLLHAAERALDDYDRFYHGGKPDPATEIKLREAVDDARALLYRVADAAPEGGDA